MTREEYIELHQKVLEEVIVKDYYPDKLAAILIANGLSKDAFTNSQDVRLINKVWNRFWFELPDLKSIRVPPFYNICDLAEVDISDQ